MRSPELMASSSDHSGPTSGPPASARDIRSCRPTAMMRFCGHELELLVDQVLARRDWPCLCVAHDHRGDRWLVCQVRDEHDYVAWICAPVSELMISLVKERQASPADVMRHSVTGTVELVALEHGRSVPDRCLILARLSEYIALPDGSLLSDVKVAGSAERDRFAHRPCEVLALGERHTRDASISMMARFGSHYGLVESPPGPLTLDGFNA